MDKPHVNKHPRMASDTNFALCVKCQVSGSKLVDHPKSYETFLVMVILATCR